MSRKRISPDTGAGANSTTAKLFPESNAHRREDGYQAPSADDHADEAFVAEALARGYRLALSCLDCGHVIVTEASLRRHRGPRCAARAVNR